MSTVAAGELGDLAARVLDLALASATPSGVNWLAAVERAILVEALAASEGNQAAAARSLGVHRKMLARRMVKHGLRAGGEAA